MHVTRNAKPHSSLFRPKEIKSSSSYSLSTSQPDRRSFPQESSHKRGENHRLSQLRDALTYVHVSCMFISLSIPLSGASARMYARNRPVSFVLGFRLCYNIALCSISVPSSCSSISVLTQFYITLHLYYIYALLQIDSFHLLLLHIGPLCFLVDWFLPRTIKS